MIRKETYTIEQGLFLIGSASKVNLDGDWVGMRSLRLLNFKVHGIKCVQCGIEGKFFAKEKSTPRDSSYHLNLYAVKKGGKEDGREILMTQDHIISKAMGGPNELTNLQCMCMPCNIKKGDGRKKVIRDGGLIKLLRSTYKPLRKSLITLASEIKAGTATQESLGQVILALNKTMCRSIHTISLREIPEEVSLKEYDTHHKNFIPIGDRAIIVHDESVKTFYIFDKKSRERLLVSFHE
jgi:hypothetical protein